MSASLRLFEFHCHSCQELTVVPEDSECVLYRECPDCFRVPALDREPVDLRLRSLLWAIHLAPFSFTATASEGDADAGSGAASAPSGAEASARAERGLAPDRAARAPEGVPRTPANDGGRVSPPSRPQSTLSDWSDE